MTLNINTNRLGYSNLHDPLTGLSILVCQASTICGCRKVAVVPKFVQSPAGPSNVTPAEASAQMTVLRSRRGEAGFTLIDMLFVVALVGLLASLAIPGLMRARGAAQASSAIGTLRVVNSGELSFAITCGLGFYAPDLPTLGVAPPGSIEPFLSDEMTAGATFLKSGYNFSLAGTALAGAPASCNGLAVGQAAPGYAAVADPLDPAITKFFGTNSDGVTYQHTVSLAPTMPEGGPPLVGAPIQ